MLLYLPWNKSRDVFRQEYKWAIPYTWTVCKSWSQNKHDICLHLVLHLKQSTGDSYLEQVSWLQSLGMIHQTLLNLKSAQDVPHSVHRTNISTPESETSHLTFINWTTVGKPKQTPAREFSDKTDNRGFLSVPIN